MSVRRAALAALTAVTEEGAYANLALKSAAAALPKADAGRVSALVYGTLDHLLTIDHYLSALTAANKNALVRNVLRLGACQLLYMRTPAHAAVNESVALCREIGKAALSGYVNGVLRALQRRIAGNALPPLPADATGRLSVQYSFPRWLVEKWVADYGETFAEALLAAEPSGLTVRPQHPCTADELIFELPAGTSRGRWERDCLHVPAGFDAADSDAFLSGRMAIQSESAMLVCRALGDCRKKRVLDACAAPGGKSACVASFAQNDVSITCFELHAHRAELTQKTLERLHVSAEVLQRDASVFDEAFRDAFDAVLVDAPCSGLGLVHGKPDVRYQKTPEDVKSLVAVQRGILDACARYVSPGGVLVYATCTISKPENEAQIAAFLARNSLFSLSPMPLPIENGGELQLFPHVHGTEGFYMARMVRCN